MDIQPQPIPRPSSHPDVAPLTNDELVWKLIDVSTYLQDVLGRRESRAGIVSFEVLFVGSVILCRGMLEGVSR